MHEKQFIAAYDLGNEHAFATYSVVHKRLYLDIISKQKEPDHCDAGINTLLLF